MSPPKACCSTHAHALGEPPLPRGSAPPSQPQDRRIGPAGWCPTLTNTSCCGEQDEAPADPWRDDASHISTSGHQNPSAPSGMQGGRGTSCHHEESTSKLSGCGSVRPQRNRANALQESVFSVCYNLKTKEIFPYETTQEIWIFSISQLLWKTAWF